MEPRFRREFTEASNPLRIPHGGHADVRCRDRRSIVVDEHPDRGDHRVEVVGRFTHAHEHDVLGAVAQFVGRHVPLGDDLLHGEMSDESHLGRFTESAAHGASDLTRDAEGPRQCPGASTHRDQDRFRLDASGESQGELDRLALDLGSSDGGDRRPLEAVRRALSVEGSIGIHGTATSRVGVIVKTTGSDEFGAGHPKRIRSLAGR